MRVIRAIPTQVIPLGRLGENECTQILFDISGWLEEYPSAAIGLYNLRSGDTVSYPVGALTTSDGSAVWTVKNSDLSAVGKGRCELVAIEDNVIVKSAIYTTQVAEALDGSGEVPEPWEDWKEEFIEIKDDVEAAASAAQDASEAIQNMGVEAGTLPPLSPATVTKNVNPETGEVTLSFGIPQGVKGDQGDKGDRGYCPTATVTKNGKTATISLTDIDGTTTATITDGDDGFTPTANVVQNNDGAKITITDVDGTTFATVYDGEDGYSPSAAVLKKDYGARISITDKNGTTFADVYNGETGNGIVSAVLNNNYTLTLTFSDGSYTTVGPIRGEKGVGITSIEKTGTSGLVDTYTITFDDGSTTTFNVTNGESVEFHICTSSEYDETTRIPTVQNPSTKTFYLVPAEDGSSPDLFVEWIWTGTTWEMFGSATIDLSNYVQKTDYATNSNAGIVKGGSKGVIISDNGTLTIDAAISEIIKTGANGKNPIVPGRQHESTFYGLAKAAGDSTQSQSSNPVGTYTDEAKTAIQTMLDVPAKGDIPEVPVQDVQVNGTSVLNQGVADVVVSSNRGLYFDTTNGLETSGAIDNEIKVAAQQFKPITPLKQHRSVFYGLAKAAGDTTQSASSNAVGTYTDAAKVAIQKMLGIDVWETIADFTLEQDIPVQSSVHIDADDHSPYTLKSFMLLCYKASEQTTATQCALRLNSESSKSFSSPSNWVSKVSNGYMLFERKGGVIIPTALAQDNNNVMYNVSGGRFIEAVDITSIDIFSNGNTPITAGHRFVLLGVRA